MIKNLSSNAGAAAAAAKSLQLCPTVQPHRRQPTRHLCPWDPPGKNTGMGCHFLLQCVKVKLLSHVRLSEPMDWSLVGLCPWGHKRVGHNLPTKLQQQMVVITSEQKGSEANHGKWGKTSMRGVAATYTEIAR